MSERIVLDLDGDLAQGSGNFEPLPEGWYDVIIDDVEARTSKSDKNSGKPMYGYKFKVEGGDFDGRIVFTNACLWKEAIFTQRDIQQAIGTWESGNGKLEINTPEELIGQTLKIKVAIREYNGEQQNDVKRFLSSDGAAPKAKAKKSGGFSL